MPQGLCPKGYALWALAPFLLGGGYKGVNPREGGVTLKGLGAIPFFVTIFPLHPFGVTLKGLGANA
jgi:hypothetical protein